MRKLSKVLIIVGIVLIVAGFGIQIIAANNSNFKMISEVVERTLGQKVTPQLVNSLMNEGIDIFGGRVTINDLLSLSSDNSEAAKIITYAKIYAATPTMIYVGIGLVVLGFVLYIVSKRK